MSTITCYRPILIAVWCKRVNQDFMMLRTYPVDESSLESGEHTAMATFPNGVSKSVRVSIPNTAVLRAPGECDSRQEFFDRVMRTQFVAIDSEYAHSVDVPFVISDYPITLRNQHGLVTVVSLAFHSDPGYRCAVEECMFMEMLSGKSIRAQLETEVARHQLQEGDVVPVIAEAQGKSVAGIVVLTRRRGQSFECTLWTLDTIESEGEILLRRKIRAKMLDIQTGKVSIAIFDSTFGRFTRLP